jgi:hypothetical protein
LLNGSSRRRILGSPIRARAMARRCLIPPEREPTLALDIFSRPSGHSTSSRYTLTPLRSET